MVLYYRTVKRQENVIVCNCRRWGDMSAEKVDFFYAVFISCHKQKHKIATTHVWVLCSNENSFIIVLSSAVSTKNLGLGPELLRTPCRS